jgi:hypothetical protein
MSKRLSITLSEIQQAYIQLLADRAGTCPTAYVFQLVVNDISRNLASGVIGRMDAETTDSVLLGFVRSLISDDGIDLSVVRTICEKYDISESKMYDVLGVFTPDSEC